MRQIVLDTETTGLNPRTGDRILEIGAVELNNRMLTGNNFHHYINPERDSEEGALAVHGLTTEFKRLNLPPVHEQVHGVIDTLVQAKEMHPGKRNSLDALCDRYGVSNAHRKLHGALLDSELLADVYLAMTRGQNSLSMEEEVEVAADGGVLEIVPLAEVIFQSATADELAAHEATIAGLDKAAKGQCIWTAVTAAPAAA